MSFTVTRHLGMLKMYCHDMYVSFCFVMWSVGQGRHATLPQMHILSWPWARTHRAFNLWPGQTSTLFRPNDYYWTSAYFSIFSPIQAYCICVDVCIFMHYYVINWEGISDMSTNCFWVFNCLSQKCTWTLLILSWLCVCTLQHIVFYYSLWWGCSAGQFVCEQSCSDFR